MSTQRERILAALEAERDMYAREVGAIGIEIVSAAIDIVERELASDAERLQKENARLRELIQRTIYHAEQMLLILPPEMVREFKATLEDRQC